MDMSRILVVVNDLFFGERLGHALPQLGHQARVVDLSMDSLPAELPPADLLLVDLEGGEPALAAIRQAKAAGMPALAFGPHVDLALREAALAAGAAKVVAKSKLTSSLAELLAEFLPQ
jgi:CheY-like chemotaxis protein